MPQYVVKKSFNKYKTVDEVIELPNEFVGEAEVEKLVKDGNVVPTSEPEEAPKEEAPEAVFEEDYSKKNPK